VQSGSDRILEAMNRNHTRADYLRLIEGLRTAQPKLAFSSDFIVGFPGETEEDFQDTRRLAAEVGFASAYTFKYSPRPGTPAADLEQQVAEDDKHARLQWLQCDIDRLQADFLAKGVGTTMDVLFEKPGQRAGQIVGRSPYLQSVHVMAPLSLMGEIHPVTITDVGTNTLFGTLVHPHAAEPMLAEA
jgi:tRNA-2-methylthio-N6-dimethylallyladenosine synthase